MIKIAICDSQVEFLDYLEHLIIRYAMKNNIKVYLKKFTSALHLLDSLEQEFQVFYLDILMPFMDGLEMAKIIRKRDQFAYIVFITSTNKYVYDAYGLEIRNYIKKPVSYQILSRELHNMIQYMNQYKNEFMMVKNREGLYKVYLSTIIYIETYNRNTLIHTENQDVISYKKMQDYETALSEYYFYRCHSSFIVNMEYVIRIEKLEITLSSGEKIPLSKQRRKLLVQNYSDYISEWISI